VTVLETRLCLLIVVFAGCGAPEALVNLDSGIEDAGPAGFEADGGLTVQLIDGLVEGVVDGETFSFRGLPYAAPPVGVLRWAPPAPPLPWTGVRAAAHFGSDCTQVGNDGEPGGTEDCLFLNLWTPTTSTAGARPVMVFIHGGGLSQGSGAQPIYAGADLARNTQTIVVTFNYRLGALGFLAHPALSAEVTPSTSGNYGALDQLAALAWVRQNIARFGGDPTKVTLFGESAGATSVATLLTSPLAKGLFARVILQSAAFTAHPTLSTAEAVGDALASELGCASAPDVVGCLRALPANTVLEKSLPLNLRFQTLLEAPRPYRFLPVIDGQVLTGQPLATFRSGGHHPVPVMIGNNATEAGYFALNRTIPRVTDLASYRAALDQLFGSKATSVLATYPAATDSAAFGAYLAALSDAVMLCRARTVARALIQGQTEPVYRFHFTQTLRGPQRVYGSFHTLELFFLFRTLAAYSYAPDSRELAVSDSMQGYWGRFAATGDPNGGNATAWPLFVTGSDDTLELGETQAVLKNLRTDQCDFWDSTGLY
jgi:para-nitrobenzyl esterase